MPVDKDIAEYLEDLGHGTVGTDIFVGWMPDSPDNCIVVTATGGQPPEMCVELESPGFQVRVRNTSSSAGWTAANNILDDLHDLTNTTIESRMYHYIKAQQSVNRLGKDGQDRSLFSINFIAFKTIE